MLFSLFVLRFLRFLLRFADAYFYIEDYRWHRARRLGREAERIANRAQRRRAGRYGVVYPLSASNNHNINSSRNYSWRRDGDAPVVGVAQVKEEGVSDLEINSPIIIAQGYRSRGCR